ncbi:MAG: universal stress protein [Muribaculaceae bacterium]|nr:universal stress protein [Muribaculaceae bacterium]
MSEESENRLITVAIHTYDKAIALRSLLESEGIAVTLNNVNLEHPSVFSGIRVRIHEKDLPLALRIIENHEIFIAPEHKANNADSHYILVPVDLSEQSLHVVTIAAAIAVKHKASLTLLNSFIDPYISGEGVQLTDALTYDIIDAAARQQIATSAKKAMDDFAGLIREKMKAGEIEAVKFSTEVVEGVPEDAISAYAKTNPPLLTVMGTRGADKKEKEMIGSVAAEVLDSARYPVMTVPEPVAPSGISPARQILFFCNADQDDILAMDTLLRLYPDAEASVTMVVIPTRRRWLEINRPRSAADALTDYFRTNYTRFTFECVSTNADKAAQDVRRLNEIHHYNLIVVPNKKKRNVLSRIFHPSLAHQLIFSADIPMLVIPV